MSRHRITRDEVKDFDAWQRYVDEFIAPQIRALVPPGSEAAEVIIARLRGEADIPDENGNLPED